MGIKGWFGNWSGVTKLRSGAIKVEIISRTLA